MNHLQQIGIGFFMIGGVVVGLWLGLGQRPAAVVPPARISPEDRTLFDHPAFQESIAADQRPPVLSEANASDRARDWRAVLSRIAAAFGTLVFSFIRFVGRLGWRLLRRIVPLLLFLLATAVEIELPFLGGGVSLMADTCMEGILGHGEWVAGVRHVEDCLPG